jgi:histone acetyltransferase (RNA polymerase elongator complex component)
MPGLPSDSLDSFRTTTDRVIELNPDFVRIYPALVIKDTPLAELYNTGRYLPLVLDDAVSLCRDALVRFEQASIDVIRIGLQPTEELEKPGTILAGPYHPAFRQLVESSLLLEKMRCALRQRKDKTGAVAFQVSAKDLSAAIGQRRSNIAILTKEFGLRELRIVAGGTTLKRREPVLFASGYV